jgi:hypothetical protein
MNSQATAAHREDRKETSTTTRLVFRHGIGNLTIRVDASMPGIYRGEFYGPKPQATEAEGLITIDYPRFNPLMWGRTSASVTISPSVAWAIEIDGGVSHWDGDLRNVDLAGIDVRGGLSQVNLQLPRPTGSVRIHVSGGASGLTMRRPTGVGARVRIGGGASKLALDDQVFGAVGGPVALETPGYSMDGDRYTVEIGGGASKITIGRE